MIYFDILSKICGRLGDPNMDTYKERAKSHFLRAISHYFISGDYIMEDIPGYHKMKIDMNFVTNPYDASPLKILEFGERGFFAFVDPMKVYLGFYGGGFATVRLDIIDWLDTSSVAGSGNALDKSDLTVARQYLGGCGGGLVAFFMGGNVSGDVKTDIIDYINLILKTVDALDKGNLSIARQQGDGCNGSTYAFFGGGNLQPGGTNVIDYVNITTTTENALDVGNLTLGRMDLGGCEGDLYGFWGGGFT